MKVVSDLESCIDYILNRASEKELDVCEAALQKRRSSGTPSPQDMAKRMATSINQTIQKSVDGMTDSIRNISADLIAKEAPHLSKSEVDAIVDSWIPRNLSYDGSVKSIANGGKVNGIPSEMMYNMVCQFVSYSIGEMSKEENENLKKELGDWVTRYWNLFPQQVQLTVKSFLKGEITSGEFQKNLGTLIF